MYGLEEWDDDGCSGFSLEEEEGNVVDPVELDFLRSGVLGASGSEALVVTTES